MCSMLKDVILLSMEGCDPEIKEQAKPNNLVEPPVSPKPKKYRKQRKYYTITQLTNRTK